MENIHALGAHALLRQERRLVCIANNLSNAQTVGFKKEALSFKEILRQSEAGRIVKEVIEEYQINFEQGELQLTNKELDLAIAGEGFFKIKTPDGINYTRNGQFRLDKDQKLVQADGFPVMGKKGEIFIKGGKISVAPNGLIKVDDQEVDQLAIVTFANLKALQKKGQNLFRLTTAQEEKEAAGITIQQGYIEAANVNVVEEMIALIDTHRSFEAYTRLLQANDELDAKTANDLGKV